MHSAPLIVLLLGVVSCVAPKVQPNPISEEAMALAQSKWDALCSVCHGRSGLGDGMGAVMLNPAPRDYSDAAWQKSVTDEYLAAVIVRGGAGVGKSPLMPPSPDLDERSEVVAGLVQIIRSFAKTQ